MQDEQYQAALQYAYDTHEKILANTPRSITDRLKLLPLKIYNSKGNSLTLLTRFYFEMDVIYEFYNSYSQCKKGCNSCCHQEIAVSDVEIEYILKNTKAKLKKSPPLFTPTNHPCPFLISNQCSIYEFRPFVCRKHLSLTNNPSWCNLEVCNKYDFPLLQIGPVDQSYAYIANTVPHKDLRSIFKT